MIGQEQKLENLRSKSLNAPGNDLENKFDKKMDEEVNSENDSPFNFFDD